MKKEKDQDKPQQAQALTTRAQRRQIRLDKACRRNAKKMNKGNTARYW